MKVADRALALLGCAALGLVLIGIGLAMVWWPLSLIWFGLVLAACALLVDFDALR